MGGGGNQRVPAGLASVAILVTLSAIAQSAFGIQFYLYRQDECFSQKVENEGDVVRASFVVVRRQSRIHASTFGIDLVVKGPHGEQVHDDRHKKMEHFEFVARKKGLYQFCFINRAKYTEMIDFNVEVGHYPVYENHEKVKTEQLAGVTELITQLDQSLKNVRFQQRYLLSGQYYLENVNEETRYWTIIKAALESVALVGTSILQVYLTKCLFKRQLGE